MDAAAKRQSPIPNPPRPAFTLIELLIVISIMMILLTLTATMMRPDVEGRRVREAARSINVYLASARNRAMETGRPCGVIFRAFGAVPCAMNADQCEVPPSYCGEAVDSVASVRAVGGMIQAMLTTSSSFGTPETIPLGMVKQGDLIQLNFQGPLYTIINYTDDGNTSTLTLAHAPNTLVPWSTTETKVVPYRIFRAPIKGFAQPLQLPASTVVDLTASGADTALVNARDFTVLFSPNGAVECVYLNATRQSVVETIYLLVGGRERVDNNYVDPNTNEDTLTNYQNLNNRWVTINPQTGAVQTEPVSSCAGEANWDDAIILSRALASEALGMGGK